MTNIDQQIIDLLRPVLAAAKAIDPRIEEISLIVNTTEPHCDGVFFNFHGSGVSGQSGHGVGSALDKIKPFNPLAEKRAAFEKLRAELAELEK